MWEHVLAGVLVGMGVGAVTIYFAQKIKAAVKGEVTKVEEKLKKL